MTGRANVRDDLPAILDLILQKRLQPDIGATVIAVGDAPRALQGALPHKTVI